MNPAQGGLRVPGGHSGNFNNRGVYGYPIFIGGYYPTPYLTPADNSTGPQSAGPAPSNVTVVMPPQQQPVTPVVINYNYGTPPPSGPDQQPTSRDQVTSSDDGNSQHYLIAFKDHTIYAATAYWVDGDTLHYFTAGNVHNQASVALVDRDFTERLNREAGLEVKIPSPAK